MVDREIEHLWYFAPAHHGFPSTMAHAVQMMKACSAFGLAGVPTTLVVPRRPDTAKLLKRAGQELWELYAVPRTFAIRWCWFPYPWKWAQQGLFGLAAAIFAARNRVAVVFTRSEWVALPLWASGLPVMLELHDLIPNLALRLAVRQARAGRLLGVVCNSQALANAVISLGCPPALVLAMQNGVDLERFEPRLDPAEARRRLRISPAGPVACYAGNLHRDLPAIETLLGCAAQLPDVRFYFVGGRPQDVEQVRGQAQRQGLKNCHFVGHVVNAEVPLYLYAADVLLLSNTEHSVSHRVMSPMKMFEYLAAGRPIIAADFPVLHEVLVQEDNALLVPGGQAAAFTEAIRRVLSEPGLAQRLSAGAWRTAQQHTWLARQKRILEFMRERLLARKAGAAA
jgi:glycosyltransferase involved in cell wall biosynthesis